MTRDARLRKAEFLEVARDIVRSLPYEPNKSTTIARALERAYHSGLADAAPSAPPEAQCLAADTAQALAWITIPPRARDLLEALIAHGEENGGVRDPWVLLQVPGDSRLPESIGGERWVMAVPAAGRGYQSLGLPGYRPRSVQTLVRLGMLELVEGKSGRFMALPTASALASYAARSGARRSGM